MVKVSVFSNKFLDWLLVDHMKFEGKKNSLHYFLKARECAVLANRLVESGLEVTCQDGCSTVMVTIGDDEGELSYTVGREHPYKGIDTLLTYMICLCLVKGIDPTVYLSEYDGSLI